MHIRKCNETAGRRKEGRGRSQRVGGAQFFICEMLAKLRKAKLPGSSEKRVSRAIWFLFHYILYYKTTALCVYLLVIDNEAVTQDTHKGNPEETQPSFDQEFRSHVGLM